MKLRFKLLLSYFCIIVLSFGFAALGLARRFGKNSLQEITYGLVYAVLLAMVLGMIFAQGFLKSIHQIISAARRMAKADFKTTILCDRRDELGELAEALNRMSREIEDKINRVNTQHQQLKAVFDAMIEAVIVVDKDRRIVSVNPALEKIFKVTQEQALGGRFLEIIRNNELEEIVSQVFTTKHPVTKELTLSWPMQGVFQVNAAAISSGDVVTGCLMVIHDLTEIRRLETMRRDFVANVSHELKTPLTSIKGYVETLLEGAWEDKENRRHFLEIIKEQSDRLNRLTNDLLELSSLESRQIKPALQPVNLRELANKAILGLRSALRERAIEIENQISAGFSVAADPDKLEQVFVNLLDNAVKFNKEKGWIKIYAESSGGEAKVFVEDSGCGIPLKDLPRIFERFYRVDKARSRELGGTGLGLAIVKHIVELHSGTVGVESAEGFGAKFWFSLPTFYPSLKQT